MIRRSIRLLLGIILLICVVEVKAFKFQDVDGKAHTLADYKGRWVIVNFWATWCTPCLKEIPDLIALYEDRNDVMVIGVAMAYSDPNSVMSFVRSMAITYPTVLGSGLVAAQLDEVSVLPSTYFFDPNGNPAARQQGLVTRKSIEAFIDGQ